MNEYNLTVRRLNADTLDITTVGGPPEVVLGYWVEATMTNGEVEVVKRYPFGKHPNLGDKVRVVVDDESA